ncbi:MAG: type II secretion system protein [Candidatus Doudnabacteria bacterium]|nr:type II secretion system protein [Candidatus Doudnabacteria bacterium]
MKFKAFTLAELLIALAILGVIATFTIPKILQANQIAQKNAITKEAIATVSNAYLVYKSQNSVTNSTGPTDLMQYINYVKADTVSVIDHHPTATSVNCSSGTYTCFQLHNGGVLAYTNGNCFGGTDTTNMIYFIIDPDGEYSGSTAGSGKALNFSLYVNGGIRTRAYVLPSSTSCNTTINPNPALDPTWLNWN